MKIKRIFGIGSVVGGLFLSALPISAADQSGTTDLSATVDATYMLTIPSNTAISYGAKSTLLPGELKVKGNVQKGQSITVTASPTALHNDSQNTDISYTLKKDAIPFTSDTWNEQELRDGLVNNASAKKDMLSIAIDASAWNSAKAGSYKGTIIFSAQLK